MCTFYKIGLLVTGKGEEKFLPKLLRSLAQSGRCHFKVIRRIPQLSPITSPKRVLKMVGTGKTITNKDQEIGLAARVWLNGDEKLLLLVDDLEYDRRPIQQAIFDRYRGALDTMLDEHQSARASVHFLVNMLEAYYFADTEAVNSVLGTEIADHDGDVEEIRHPKNVLKNLHSRFREIEHGEAIVGQLDVVHVLDNPQTCSSLRGLFAWCIRSILIPWRMRGCQDTK